MRIEEMAFAWREVEVAMVDAEVDRPEQRQKLRPGAVASVHRVGVLPALLLEPLEESVERVVL